MATAARCYRFYQQTGASRGFYLGVARGESERASARAREGEREKKRTKRVEWSSPQGAADDRHCIRRSRENVTYLRTARGLTRRASPAHPPGACWCRCCTRPLLGHPRCAVIANPPAVHTTTRHHHSAILPATEIHRCAAGGATGRACPRPTGDL